MRALIQRVSEGSVSVDDKILGQIGKGVVILLGITHEDTEKEADYLADKIANLRIFPGDSSDSDFNTSLLDNSYEVLAISQFTLYGSCNKGRRPDFNDAARPEEANKLYEYFVEKLKAIGLKVETGQFQAHMMVNLTNDGPVTLMIESK